MKVTPSIVSYEFVGAEAKVVMSRHVGYLGISGKIIDETKNTFLILQGKERKSIIKESAIFHFTFSDGTVVEINGSSLVGRPEDRVKKRIRRLW